MSRTDARGLLRRAVAERWAIPAFNVSNLETTQAVIAAAEDANGPVILQLSPGAIAYAGYETLRALVFDLADTTPVPTVVHLDHCREVEVVERAIADGFGSIMFDGSRRSFEENVAATRRLVDQARAADPTMAVEAELGVIGGREDTTPEEAAAARTTPEEAARFVEATGIDVIAPALGNLHRMPDDSTALDLGLVGAIAAATGRPIALHGGSGIDQGQLRAAIDAGIAKVNISSRVTRALAAGIRATWVDRPDELDLRRFLGAGRDQVRAMALTYFDITGAAGRAGEAAGVGSATWAADDPEPE